MKQEIRIVVRVTKEQKSLLEAKSKAEGYSKVAFYLRAKLFQSLPMEEKIGVIYKKICGDS